MRGWTEAVIGKSGDAGVHRSLHRYAGEAERPAQLIVWSLQGPLTLKPPPACQSSSCTSLLHSLAWTRAISLYPPVPSGSNTEASPSLTFAQSWPKASTMFGLWVTITTLLSAGGRWAT